MLKRDDPRFIEFRVEAEIALLATVHHYEDLGLSSDEAIERVTSDIQGSLLGFPYFELPELDAYGWLPPTHSCIIEEFERRFGQSTRRRQELTVHVREIVRLGQEVGALRLIVGGSFVTSKENPGDVDAAMLVPQTFFKQLAASGDSAAKDLWDQSQSDSPVQLFLERNEESWWGWYRLFSLTLDPVHLYRGVVKIRL